MILVIKKPKLVFPYLVRVQKSADKHKDKLGFWSKSAYEELCLQGKLWIATDKDKYAVHLLFGGTFPQLRVFQIFVLTEYRGQGIAKRLN